MWNLGSDASRPEWREATDVPFKKNIFEVAHTAEGPYAVGDSGTIIGKEDGEWTVVIDDGPNVRQNALHAVDVTDDGKRIWFAGTSGALGCYDVETRRKYDYSYPHEMTSTWEGIAVAGNAGSEKGLIANGSGEVLPFVLDGFDVNWEPLSKPGSGAKIAALAAAPDGVGYAINTSGDAYVTTKDDGWENIGIVNAQVKFYDIWAGANRKVYVAAGDGRLYRYDDSYRDWTPIGVAQESLRSFDMYDDQMVVLGSSGTIYQRVFGGRRWEQLPSPTDKDLYDLALGNPDIAVGEGATILERPRGTTRQQGTSPDGDNYDNRGETYDEDDNAPGEETQDGSGDSTSDGSTSDGSTSGSSSGS